MRHLLLLLALISVIASFGQEWTLVRLGWKYNYGTSDNIIHDQIFITDVDSLGFDSIRYDLNRVAEWCDTCSIPLQTDLPQFLQRSIYVTNDQWLFFDPSSFLILPEEQTGGSWIADTLNAITAQVIQADTLIQFGVLDVQKTIQCSNGDIWIISKEWGVLQMNEHELIGIQGPNVGTLIPSIIQMYPYQPGDIVEYEKHGLYDIYPFSIRHERLKHQIFNRTESDTSITFNTWLVKWITTSIPLGSTQFSTTHYQNASEDEFVTSQIELPYRDLLLSYPGALISSQHLITADSPHGVCIARHYRDSLNRYTIESDVHLDSSWVMTTGNAKYIEGIGLLNYDLGGFEYYTWKGSVIAGDTSGVIHSDEYFLAINDQQHPFFQIKPNPVSEMIFLTELPETKSNLILRDAIGRMILEKEIGSQSVSVDVADLAEGIYYLTVEGFRAMRVVIVR